MTFDQIPDAAIFEKLDSNGLLLGTYWKISGDRVQHLEDDCRNWGPGDCKFDEPGVQLRLADRQIGGADFGQGTQT